MSDSLRPHRWQPTRLRCPWDSPGKNTGVGCHFLPQCMKVKSESEVAQSVRLLVTPWTAAHQAPPSMGFSRQENWSGVPLPSPDSSYPVLKTEGALYKHSFILSIIKSFSSYFSKYIVSVHHTSGLVLPLRSPQNSKRYEGYVITSHKIPMMKVLFFPFYR